MDYILDTHVIIWALEDDDRLSDSVRDIILDNNNNIYFSALSIMEVSIKHHKNPKIMKWSGQQLYEYCLEAGYYTMPFKPKHAFHLENLKVKDKKTVNQDPFDRGLIAQAKAEGMYLISFDKLMHYYDESCILDQ